MNEVEQSRHPRPAAPLYEGLRPRCHSVGAEKNLAIEVKVEGSVSNRPQRFTPRFDEDENWELLVYYARPAGLQNRVSTTSNSVIATFTADVEKLTGEGRGAPALLVAWATLEALGRILLPEKFGPPQTPARLVEVLASEGFITPSEADLLRKLAAARNHLVHGQLDQDVSSAELTQFIGILRLLLSFGERSER